MPSLPTLTIRLSPRQPSGYPVVLSFEHPEGGIAHTQEYGNAEFDFAALRRQANKPAVYGRLLSGYIFKDQNLRIFFEKSLAIAKHDGQPYRLRLSIDIHAPELHRLFWETLCLPSSGELVTQDANLHFCREPYSSDLTPIRPRPRGELRALIAIASPAELNEDPIPGQIAMILWTRQHSWSWRARRCSLGSA